VLAIIAAVAKNNAIGKNNKLLWHLPNDLQRFKRITSGHTVIMGRKTFLSLPGLLPNRKHIVLTRDMNFAPQGDVQVVHSLSELFASLNPNELNFVIGGAEVYAQLLPYSERLYLTVIDREFAADAFFPAVDYAEWELIEEEQGMQDSANPLPYRYLTYQRKPQN